MNQATIKQSSARTELCNKAEDNRFLFSCLEDNQINLAELLGPAFYEEPAPVMPEFSRKQSLLRQLGIKTENAPTSREKDVIRLLLEGYLASEIGKQTFLSSRTIEHHLERIKDKLGCDSRAELIQKARELEAYGLL